MENLTLQEWILISIMIFLVILLCMLSLLSVWLQDREWKKKFAKIEVGEKYFLLNMDTTYKSVIEIIAKDEKNMSVTIQNVNNKEDIITVYYRALFSYMLVKNTHHYYEKL